MVIIMNMKLKRILMFLSVCLLHNFNVQAQAIGGSIPSVVVKTLEGQAFNTSGFKNEGKPIIIDFWATWCKPCVAELSAIAEQYSKWQEETGVKVIAISIDDVRSSSSVAPFVDGKYWDFDVYLDENGDFKRAMNVNNVPHLFIINGKGEITSQHNTYNTGDEERIHEELLKIKNKK